MKVHRVIDVLRGRDVGYRAAVPNVEDAQKPLFIDWMDDIASRIERAQHFVFENIPMESDAEEGSMTLPGVTPEERDMFSMGLLPLPFESCWFEAATPSGSEYLSYYLEETETGYRATPFRVLESGLRGVQVTGEHWDIVRGVPEKSAPTVDIYDTFGGAALMHEMQQEYYGGNLDRSMIIKGEVGFLTYLLLMLSSRTTEVREEQAPVKLNKKRKAKGLAPIPAHRVVSIIPRGAVREYRDQERAGGTANRSSPRIHWRRSHLRQLANGKTVVVARALVGYKADPERESVSHSYRVRL